MMSGMEPQDLNLAICGHAWHGKSTLLGKLVAESGMATQREVEEAHRQASEGRDPSLVFAQLVFRSKDTSHGDSEAARGITILPSIVRFEFNDTRVTVIDTPGQETYTNNRFFGMFQADAAMLVVDVKHRVQPITRQVIRILRGFEIPLRAVVMTKMDQVGYEEGPFLDAVEEVKAVCREYEVDPDQAVFIPASAYAPDRDLHELGEGLTRNTRMPWYDGPTVRDFVKGLTFAELRPREAPLRLAIHGSEVYDHVPGIGKTATALVETGVVRSDMTLHFEPISTERKRPVTARVRSVQLTRGHFATPGIPLEQGVPRQLVGIAFKNLSEKEQLRELFKGRGAIAGTVEHPPRVAHRLLIELTVFDKDTLVHAGAQWTMHVHVDRVPIQVEKMLERRDAEGGPWQPAQPEDPIATGEWGRMEVTTLTRPVAIEESATVPQLAKLVLRLENKAIAYGRCLKILA